MCAHGWNIGHYCRQMKAKSDWRRVCASCGRWLSDFHNLAKHWVPLVRRFEKLMADIAAYASVRTLKEPDVSSSKELVDTTPSEESITANPQTVPQSITDSSPLSTSSLGPKILFRCRPNWYQVYFIRMDRSGCFWMYPDLGGPFESLDEADDAINSHSHLDKLRCQAMFDEQGQTSVVDRLVYEHNHYLDGTPKRGPNSRRRKSTIIWECYLVEALVNQYNDVHNLLGVCSLSLSLSLMLAALLVLESCT
uniref:Uncharacterized protein n=1 Tax=Arundo donax TaxID=35708 RepID=A0A0A9GBM8_ARUDO